MIFVGIVVSLYKTLVKFVFQDVGSKASDFGYVSGLYTMELIVGDSVLSNSFSWTVADVNLKFGEHGAASGPMKDQYLYATKPEIKVFLANVISLIFHI